MKLNVICALSALAVLPCAAVTINLSGTTTTSATFVQNKAGVATNGLTWGLLVADSTGVFATSNAIGNYTGALATGTLFGTSYLLFSSAPATTNITKAHTDFGTSVITNGAALSMTYTMTTETNGRQAKLIWFDGIAAGSTVSGNGSQSFGVSGTAFTLPTTNTATLTVTATDGQNGPASTTFGMIPEPSSVLLGTLGVLGLLRRRRN